jgi:Holliday junction resolvase-like predicted endonuclease
VDECTPLMYCVCMQATLPLFTNVSTQDTGVQGEQTAQYYLRDQGYSIYNTNVRLQYDEIDIIAYDHGDKVLVFCEVKTRSRASSFFNPMLNITNKKKQAMFRAARLWIAQAGYSGPYRLDVLCVIGSTVTEHLLELGAE